MLGTIRRQVSKVEVEGKVDKRRFSKLEMSHVAGAMDSVTKSKLLERSLRDSYCRPMIKMFKYFNSDDMMVLETPDFDEVLYNEMTKVQLKKHIDAFKKANESLHAVPQDLVSHLLFDRERTEQSRVKEDECRDLIKDLNLRDLDDILSSKSSNPKVFVAYLKMIKLW